MNDSTSMSGTWHPIYDNHAIDVMGVVVSFTTPIPEIPFKRVLKGSEDVAFEQGLRSRHSLQQNIEIALIGGQPAMAPSSSGRVYNSLDEVSENNPVPARVVEQLQVMPNLIIYRTWRYISWQWHLARLRMLMSPALQIAADIVPLSTIRLEYLDRFRFDGEPRAATVADVLRRDSDRLAPHIFSRADLWHSHSGAYLPDEGSVKRLEQVHVDALDEGFVGVPTVRWLNLMTARENRFNDSEVEQTPDGIFSTLNEMHSDLIDLAESVLNPAMARRIYLKAEKK